MPNWRNLILVLLFVSLFSSMSFSQDLIEICDDMLSYEEKVEIGKAYIDETFPDCDFDYLYSHCVFNKDIEESNEDLTKDSWAETYPWEYELYIYYNKKQNELSLSPEEIELRKENEEKDRLEKEKYFNETKK